MDGRRRRVGPPIQLQWGHGREAMDGTWWPSSRKRTRGFNGAMAVRPWMAAGRLAGRRVLVLQWGHGREAMDGRATSVQAREASCFNGAMAVRPWMVDAPAPFVCPPCLLQWGHGREAMDGPRPRRVQHRRPASMGPWP